MRRAVSTLSALLSPSLKKEISCFATDSSIPPPRIRVTARGLGAEKVESLNALAVGDVKIDLTIFLDFPPEKAFDRKGGRDTGDRLENEKMEFHKRVYEGFCAIAAKEPERVVRLDASGSKDQTHEKIIKTLIEKGIIPAENDAQ